MTQDSFSSIRTSSLLYGCSDFYTATSMQELYEQLDQVLFDLFGRSNFSLFFPIKAENQLIAVYSTYPNQKCAEQWQYDLDNPWIQSILEFFNNSGMLITNAPQVLDHWPFEAKYCSLLREEETVVALLVVHDEINEDIYEPFPVLEILEPVIKHFTQALMNLKANEEIERSLSETNARLLAINDIGELLGQLDLDVLLSKMMMLALQLIRAEVGNLLILDKGHLRGEVEWGLTEDVVKGITWRDGTPMVERVLEYRLPLLIEDLQNDPRFITDKFSRHIHSIVSLPLFTTKKEPGVLNVVNTQGNESFSADNTATLQTVTSLASTAIENAMLHRDAIEREVFQEQLRIARQIWENILPRKIPTVPGATISARSLPANVVGGDFYDFIPLKNGQMGIVLADVSGKGIPAAMIMNMAKSVLHIEALRGGSPNEVLKTVNNLLVESTKLDSFVTLIYAVYDHSTHKIQLVNAGHTPTMIYRKDTGLCEEYKATNIPVAIVQDQDFDLLTVEVKPGDCLVFYTDGVNEAMNNDREMFETDRLKELLQKESGPGDANAIIDSIYERVGEFVGDAPQQDDTTVVVFKISE